MANSPEKEITMNTPSISHLLSLPTTQRTEILQSALTTYPTLLSPKLTSLDEIRYKTIPTLLESQSHLTKPHLLQLLEWKLSHGKFRPTLKKLVDSNSEESIEETTRRGTQALREGRDVKSAMNILTELRGIGPATASLVLSCADPEGTVFFGDEVAAWVFGDWKAKLKYNLKEYLELYEKVREVKGELGLSAVEMEKVGYVFGKRFKGVEGGEQGKGEKRKAGDGEVEVEDTRAKKTQTKTPASRKKAKVEDVSPPPAPAGTRRSTRSKKA